MEGLLSVNAGDLNAASFEPDIMIRCHRFGSGSNGGGTVEGQVLKTVQLLTRGKVGEGAIPALARITVTFLKWAPIAILETLTPLFDGNEVSCTVQNVQTSSATSGSSVHISHTSLDLRRCALASLNSLVPSWVRYYFRGPVIVRSA